MQKQLESLKNLFSLAFCCLMFLNVTAAENPPVNGDFSTSNLCFNLDDCSAYEAVGTNFDYSEFTPIATNSTECLQMSSTGLYRDEPLRNPHSCTEGVNGGTGVCVSSVMSCTYPAGHMRSIKIDVQVTPGTDGTGTLSSINFYEQAPVNYNWIDGPSGTNNYPTRYGIRVLKDGTEVWRSADNATTNDWTLESFSFLNEPAFTVTQPAVFTFEFIGYCLVGNGAINTAWDLDEIKIESSCGTVIDGGALALPGGGTSTGACVGTGTSAPINVVVSGNQGPSGAYIITDENGVILELPANNPPFDFGSAGVGTCLIWYASYSGNLTGLTVGANAADIVGCFDLSNPVTVDRYTAAPGTISTTTNGAVCANGNMSVDVTLTGNSGESRWIITDTNGNIVGLPTAPPFDFSQYTEDNLVIWHLGFQGNIAGLAIGNNANALSGTCFALSNSIAITKQSVNGGVLASGGFTYINICEGNGTSNIVDVVLNGNSGNNSQIVLTDGMGNIIDANPSFPYDFSGLSPDQYEFYNVSWNDNLTGLTVGSNINVLSGFCYELSNSVTVDKELASGGTIGSPNGTTFDLCIQGTISDPIDISLSGNTGQFSRWLITDVDGNIIALPNTPPFVLDPLVGGTCVIWHLGFEDSFNGLFIGQNVAEFSGCYGLSNSITINKRSSSGGIISQGGFTFIDICGVNSSQTISVDIFNNIGNNSQFIISDLNGNIIALTSNPDIDFSSYANGSYNITHVSYHSGISGLNVGGNLNGITGDCVDFSNTMTINKYNPSAGSISSPAGGVIDVCNDGFDDMIEVNVTGNSGGFERWLITDLAGNIIGLPNNPPFNFEGYPDGSCLIWHLSYENGISGLGIGNNANDLDGCFRLSNSIQVNKQSLESGTIDIDGATSISICLEDNIPDVVTVNHSGSNSANGSYVVTDNAGNILEVVSGPDFDFSGTTAGTCRIYFVGYEDIAGLTPGGTISGLTGCYTLSNFITVFRSQTAGGTIVTDGNSTNVSVCVGDGFSDLVDVTLSGSNQSGTNQWVITDDLGNILGLPSAPPFEFDGAGTGVCSIWNLNYAGNITGLIVGENVGNLQGCYSLSNAITVNRYDFDSSSSSSTMVYNLNACSALTGSTQFDFNEFTPIVNNSPACTQLSGSNIYRNDPMNYPHSCTPGLNGSTALCVSSYDNCTYEADNAHAIRFEVTLTPSGNGTATFNKLSFYEAAPLNFQWISGTSGPNNYPTQYGIRITKNGNEIFRQTDIPTTNAYTLENFDFTANPEFTVSSVTTFNIELLGYCLIGLNTAPATAWDIDDVTIVSECSGGLNGGNLTIAGTNGSTEMTICADDNIDDIINVDLLNAAGPNMAYVITDSDLNILALPMSQPFNLEGAGGGTCLIWNLSYIDGLQGAVVGANAADLQGCYSLSNPITVIRNIGADCAVPIIVTPGNLTSIMSENNSGSFCIQDGFSDMVDMNIEGNQGSGSSWIITNEDGVIIDIPAAFPYDFDQAQEGISVVYHVAYEGSLNNMSLGNSIDLIEGNYALSNGIAILTERCLDGNTISVDYPADFSVYPNPSSNMLTIKNDVPSKFGSTVYIYDSFGKLIKAQSIKTQAVEVDISGYSEGFYYIKMIAGENESTRPFTKM